MAEERIKASVVHVTRKGAKLIRFYFNETRNRKRSVEVWFSPQETQVGKGVEGYAVDGETETIAFAGEALVKARYAREQFLAGLTS